jgi:transmembrane protein 18
VQAPRDQLSLFQHFEAFRHAITWSEWFILLILLLQLSMLILTCFACRRKSSLSVRIFVMMLIAALVRSAEFLNQLGSVHWKKFATQNYFDKHGVFLSIMLSAPLLLDSFALVIAFLREASQLLVIVKTNQIKLKRRQEATKENNAQQVESNISTARRGKKEL